MSDTKPCRICNRRQVPHDAFYDFCEPCLKQMVMDITEVNTFRQKIKGLESQLTSVTAERDRRSAALREFVAAIGDSTVPAFLAHAWREATGLVGMQHEWASPHASATPPRDSETTQSDERRPYDGKWAWAAPAPEAPPDSPVADTKPPRRPIDPAALAALDAGPQPLREEHWDDDLREEMAEKRRKAEPPADAMAPVCPVIEWVANGPDDLWRGFVYVDDVQTGDEIDEERGKRYANAIRSALPALTAILAGPRDDALRLLVDLCEQEARKNYFGITQLFSMKGKRIKWLLSRLEGASPATIAVIQAVCGQGQPEGK